MGKFDGKHIRGLVGAIVQRVNPDGTVIVQGAPREYTQTKNTKKAGKVFGQGSVLAAEVRRQLGDCYGGSNHDSGLVNRFNTPVKDVLRLCFEKETGIYTFEKNSFARLVGFEFNIKSLLINSFFVTPEVVLEGDKLKVTIPEFDVAASLKFPRSTTSCEFVIVMSQVALKAGYTKNPDEQSFTVGSKDTVSASKEFVFDVLEDCLCTVSLGLTYYSKHGDLRKEFNSKDFSPACVIGAIYNPGTFVDPPGRVENGKHYAKDWDYLHKLKLRPVEEVEESSEPPAVEPPVA